MVAFDQGGGVRWVVPNDQPMIATDDGGVIGMSGTTYDQNGNVTGTATLNTYSWTGNSYQQSGSVEQVIDYLLTVSYDLASSFWPIVGGNYSSTETGQALVRTYQDNVVNSKIWVPNPSQSNPNQNFITDVFSKILSALNSGSDGGGCGTWLTGSSIPITQYLSYIFDPQNYGHGTFTNYINGNVDLHTAAFSGGRNSDDSLTNVPANYAFTVNDAASFFNSSYPDPNKPNITINFYVGTKKYSGNTLKAQATILVHEFAHQSHDGGGGASGFQYDTGKPNAGRSNDQLVDQYCRKLIEGLR
jgi:hypothetical protein